MPRSRLALVPVLTTLAACPAVVAPEGTPIHATGSYVHRESRLQFPERIGTFHRAEMATAERDGILVGYDHENSEASIAFTVCVRRPLVQENGTSDGVDREFALALNAIREEHPDAVESWSHDLVFTDSGRALLGSGAGFHYRDLFDDTTQDLDSSVYVFDRDGWIVTYRMTWAAPQREAAERLFARFFKIVPWGTSAAWRGN